MAEIKIEKKRTIWPWIVLGIIVIALLVYFLAIPVDRGEEEVTETTVIVNKGNLMDETENNSTVAAYVAYVEDSLGQMDMTHEYTHDAIVKLTNAIEAMAGEIGFDVGTNLDEALRDANMITRDEHSTKHANHIRDAADILARTLLNMQKEFYPGLSNQAQAVMDAADKIKPGELTLEQKDAIKSFFWRAADLLKKMN